MRNKNLFFFGIAVGITVVLYGVMHWQFSSAEKLISDTSAIISHSAVEQKETKTDNRLRNEEPVFNLKAHVVEVDDGLSKSTDDNTEIVAID